MSEWEIIHTDGGILKDENGNEVTIKSLEYNGSWMGECFVTASFKSPAPISFKIGDYLIYRGEVFEINYDPGKIKQSRRNEYGEAFIYENVKFNAKQDELARTEFLDIVLHDNQIHYTSLTKFSFYVSSLDDLLDRIQANLNEQWGSGAWKLYSRNRLRSGQRGCDLSVWDKVYGSGIADNVIDSTSITADGLNCWSALALINSQFDINFITRGRNVFVGTAGLPTSHIFKYGKGNGLYQIEQNADSEQAITTRLRAYGSSKNLPNRYYATLNLQTFATVVSIDGKGMSKGNYNIFAQLDLPFSISYFYNPLYDFKDGRKSYLVTLMCGGQKVQASVFKTKGATTTSFFAAHNNTADFASHKNSLDDIRKFGDAVKIGEKIIFLFGVKKESFPKDYKSYATDNLPNNMAIDRLMLPGFPNKSLKQWWSEQSEEAKQRIYKGDKVHLFSENKYRPYIDSANVREIGVRPNSVYFDNKDIQQGIEDIYPTIEKMEINGIRIDEVKSADTVEDNGVFKDGSTIPNFHIYLKAAIDFDINDLIGNSTEQPTISMKDGMCAGRAFQIGAVSKQNDGSWELTCQRVKDESLNLYFPYNDYQIKTGDHFVLLGIPLPDSYVEAASVRLLKYALAFLDKNDYTRYVYSPKVDEVYMQRQHDLATADVTGSIVSLHDTIKEGDIMQFEDADLRIEGKVSIDQLTIRETDGKIPTYEITLREDKSVGTIQKLQEKINSIESGNSGVMAGGGGNNLTVPQIQRLIEAQGEKRFLSKLTPDTAQELITFIKGVAFNNGAGIDGEGRASLNSVQIGDFVSKLSGGVFRQDADGTTYLETDRLYVRMKAYFESLEIVKTQYSYGNRIVGKGGIVISKVEMIDNRGNITENKLECSVYRCYFINKQEGLEIYNPFVINDQAFTKEDNLKKGTTKHTTNHYLWRAVAGVGDDFVDLSENICLVGSDAPLVGDNLCQFGYRGADKPDRTCAIMESITGENVPSYIMLQDITDFSLAGKEVLMFGFDNGTGKAFFKVYGDSYTGNKERTEYFEYKDGKAMFSGEAHFKAGSTGGENIQGITTSSANLIINSGFVGNYETRQLEDNTPLKKGTEMYSPSLFGWNGTAKVVSNQASMSGCSVILSDESVSQPIKMGLSIAASYAFSCKAKGNNLTVRIGGYEKIISLTSDFQTIKVLAIPTGGSILELIGNCELCEPMLVVGNVFSTWQPSPLDNNKATSIKQALSYLQEALENDTTINGGLLLSTLIKVGRNVQGKWKEAAGMSGISNDDNDVAFYAGGTFEQAIRTVMSYIGNPQYKPSEQELSEMAQFVVTHGGQAIFNNAILRGLIYADGGILRNIRTPNDSLKINENGDIEIVGKFESAVNGKRIVIDPENGNVMLKEEHLLSDGSKMELPSIRIDVNDIHIANQDIANIPNLSCFRYDKNGVIEKIVSLSTADVRIESETPKNNYYATFGETGAWFMSYNKLTQKADQMEVGISDLSDEDGKPTGAGLFFRATRYPTYEESPIGGVYLDGETLKVKLK